jgi:hypothetical protein
LVPNKNLNHHTCEYYLSLHHWFIVVAAITVNEESIIIKEDREVVGYSDELDGKEFCQEIDGVDEAEKTTTGAIFKSRMKLVE